MISAVSTGQVPFRITDIDLGFQEAEGVIRFENGRVVLEYRIKDALGLSVRSEKKGLHLPMEELVTLEIRDWLVSLRLYLAVRSIRSVSELPGRHSGELTLKVSRKYRRLLYEFGSSTRLALTQYRFRQHG
ncbi:MAG: hypothetical protein WEC12_08375 [Balneolaceae bacterium]